MLRSQRRLLLLIAFLPVLIVAAALLYMTGMWLVEGAPRTFWQALEWSAETLSTTGYGRDNTWGHPAMVVFVIIMQFAGDFRFRAGDAVYICGSSEAVSRYLRLFPQP